MSWEEWTREQAKRCTNPAPDIASVYHDDPVGYFRHELQLEPWSRQAGLLRDVAEHDRVITRSGHKVGKSNSAAGLALWWAETRIPATVLITSPTANQVKLIVWNELRHRYRNVRHRVGGVFPKDPKTALTCDNGNRIFGLSTKEPENIAGVSGENLMVIVDEGSGYPDELFVVLEGNLAGGGKLVAFGNPTMTTGWFFEAFRGRRGKWKTNHISSAETPNVTERKSVIPGLATYEYVRDMREKYGPDYERDPIYAVRVAGEFAEHASDAVIGIGPVAEAQRRWPTAIPTGKLRIGVDVARFGDDETVIQAIRGHYAYPPETLRGKDGIEVSGHVIGMVKRLAGDDREIAVQVDGIGVGASVVDSLKSSPAARSLIQPHGNEMMPPLIVVNDVQVGSRATDEDHHNLRSQIWFGIADWFGEGGAIPDDSDLEQELLAPIYKFDVQGRKQVESKADIKKKILRSPDRADALALAIYKAPEPFKVRGLYIPGL